MHKYNSKNLSAKILGRLTKQNTTEQEHHKNGIKPTDLGLANRDFKCDFSDTS